jgi:23S rRNA pseudouridine2605 synthase
MATKHQQQLLHILQIVKSSSKHFAFVNNNGESNKRMSSVSINNGDQINNSSSQAQEMRNTVSSIENDPIRNSRLSKLVAEAGLCSRREAERWIIEGRITINDVIVTSASRIVNRDNDKVCLDGEPLFNQQLLSTSSSSGDLPLLWGVYKSAGELVALRDDMRQRPCLLQRLSHLAPPSLLRPVLHQEFNTEGLCLMTDSAKLARALGRADTQLLKHYRLRINGLLSQSKIDGLRRGMFIENKRQPSINVAVERVSGTMTWIRASSTERSSKVIKRCLEHMHINVTRVICVGVGPYKLGDLPPGGTRSLALTPEVLKMYRKIKS